ncbi:uncharacterized protein [Littorina saxatilis]|uniref:Uncharacterized protein n=1 Tax=Littorina saxatilis TaxID=31220 RepID=A0AAN9GEU8_9CAEN
MSTQNYLDQNKDGPRTSNILPLTPIANPSAHPDQPAPQLLTAVVPNESSAVRNSIGPTRYTDGYTYVDINDVPAARTSLNAEQPSKRVAFQPDAINMKTRAKGDNHTEDDSVDYNTDPYDRIGNRSSQKKNKRSFKVDDDNACKPIARAHTVSPKGDVYSQVNKVRQTVAAKQEKAGYSRDQSPKKQTTKDNVNGADDLKDQKGEDGRVYANLDGTSAYNNAIVANTNGDSATSKRDDADDDNLDDQYNRLQYHRPDPQDDAQYSHIAQL